MMIFVLSSQGIIIFLILVVFHKRVVGKISRDWLPNCNLIPEEWRELGSDDTEEIETGPQMNATQNVISENNELNAVRFSDII